MNSLQALGSTVQCCAPRIPSLLASRGCLARRPLTAIVRAGVDERSIVGEVHFVFPCMLLRERQWWAGCVGGGGYDVPGSPQDFGARDPTPGELASNFTDKVLGNYDTAHIIRCC